MRGTRTSTTWARQIGAGGGACPGWMRETSASTSWARQIVADGGAVGDSALAREVRRRVERYEAAVWPRECGGPETADPERAILVRIRACRKFLALTARQA